jgi:hypothetical protein
MQVALEREIAALSRMSIPELRQRFADVFGDDTQARNKAWLVKRIAWRLQANEYGGLSDTARQRADELADEADLRLTPPKAGHQTESHTVTVPFRSGGGDDRLPVPGTILRRDYKGRAILVQVLAVGFDFDGQVYKSLTAVARAITGTHCNGYHFFRLGKDGAA